MAKLHIFLAALATFTISLSHSEDNKLHLYPDADKLLLKLGATQELHCSVNTTGENAKLSWTMPTMAGITRREETTVYSTKYLLKISLRVENFDRANAGDYTCTFSRDTHEGSRSIYLNPVEEIKMEPVFVRDSKTAALSCSITYNDQSPATLLNWLKNNKNITDRKDSNRFEILDNQTLIINNPTREDSGLYIAVFSSEDSKDIYNCEVNYTAGPLVLDFEKSKNIIEGDDLELKCIVKGYPYAVITWYKDDKIVNDSRVILQDLDGYKNAHLLIRRAEFGDAGDYSCEAFSAFTNETSSKNITVRVKDKLAALWPFLGIVGEVVLLCTIIFIYEKRKSKEIQLEENAARDIDGASAHKNEGLRHRNTNNPTA